MPFRWRSKRVLHIKYFEKAIEDCNRAIELEPKHTWAHRTRANVYKTLERK